LTVNLKSRSAVVRIASLLVGVLALMLLAGCGDSKDKNGEGPTAPIISTSINLTVEDGSFNKKAVTAKPGTIKITVTVPSSASGKHGVGINGGQYKNIKGASGFQARPFFCRWGRQRSEPELCGRDDHPRQHEHDEHDLHDDPIALHGRRAYSPPRSRMIDRNLRPIRNAAPSTKE
jgi:hypothetical protein